jgi:hypothetical protein
MQENDGRRRVGGIPLRPKLIYVIAPMKLWPSKIGISEYPKERVKSLQAAHYELLELIAVFKSDNALNDEGELHIKFADYKIRNEWFDINAPEAVKMISKFLEREPYYT